MKKSYVLILLVSLAYNVSSQRLLDYGISVGVSNYLGEIGGKEKTRKDFIADLKLAKTRWSGGGFVRLKLLPKVSAKLAIDYIRIEGDDKLSTNKARNTRNLNFRNDMIDLGLTGEYFFFENNDIGNSKRYKTGFRAYVFGGLGCVYSNPQAFYKGTWVNLRPLHTEGVKYKSVVLNIPVGAGCYFTLKNKHRLGVEFNWRTTFTDYLDDISAGWADPSTLTPDGLALSNRTPELKNVDPIYAMNFGWNPVENPRNIRGDNKRNDSYITMSVSYSYVLKGRGSFYRGGSGGFFNGRKKGKVRKIKAKF